jgi:uncharacterized damage-inducible protein DinB
MNRDALNELFAYTTFTWKTYDRAVKILPTEELTRPLEGSGWSALREPLVHVASAWDGWLAKNAGETFTEFDIDTIITWDAIHDLRTQARGWMRRLLDEMTDADLFEKTKPTWDGQPDDNRSTVADVLLHILLHERGHHGDVTTLLSRAGAPIANSDYLFYQFFKSRKES